MHFRHLVVIAASAAVPVVASSAASAAGEEVRCAVTEVVGIDDLGHPVDDGDAASAVVVSLVGRPPVDAPSTIGDAVATTMHTADPVWTTMRETRREVEATVSPVHGAVPAELAAVVAEALSCADLVTGAVAPARGAPESDAPESDAPEPGVSEPATDAAVMECHVTSVLPVDATGTVVASAAAAEGTVVAVTGPLPAGAAATIAEVVRTATGTVDPLAATTVEGIDGVQVTVTGTTGPLPADLSGSLAATLGCHDATPPPAGGDGPTDPSADPLPSSGHKDPSERDAMVAGYQRARSAGGALPLTGGPVGLVAGSAALGAGALASVARRLLLARRELRQRP